MIKISLIIALSIIVIAYILNKTKFGWEKSTQYECGLEILDEKNEEIEKFYLKFYIIGIIFLIFDIETILLFPLISLFSAPAIITKFGYITFIIFMTMLLLGLIYEYRKDVLK